MWFRLRAAIFVTAISAVSLGACSTEKNPTVCDPTVAEQCPTGQRCNPGSFRCEATGVADGGGEAGGSTDVDAGAADLSFGDLPVDAPPPDVTPPDAAGTCAVDEHCGPAAPICVAGNCKKCTASTDCVGRTGRGACDTVSGQCVECAASSDCTADAGKPLCTANKCVACGTMGPSAACAAKSASAPFCDGGSGKCVECLAAVNCAVAAKPLCVANACAACGTAGSSVGCAAKNSSAPWCDGVSGECAECLDSKRDCAVGKPICSGNQCVSCNAGSVPESACAARDAALPGCNPGPGTCVECSKDSHCGVAVKPMCGGYKCTACTSDAQCAAKLGANPGVCMFHEDGRCATDAETIYVQNASGCSGDPQIGGTLAKPYCQPQLGIDAATPLRHLVVMRGPAELGAWKNTAGKYVAVIGQRDAYLGSGADPAILVTGVGTSIYMRNLIVSGATGNGVTSASGSYLSVDSCVVRNNGRMGIWATAGAHIRNTVIVGNTANGALLDNSSTGQPIDFVNNTIINNGDTGVWCRGGTPFTSSLLLYGNTALDADGCTLEYSKITDDGDPRLDANYRLTSISRCRDAGDPNPGPVFPLYDIDGDPRPQGTRSDCGADEFK